MSSNTKCVHCDAPAYFGYLALAPNVSICCSCAEVVANIFNMAHSGKYLTWPNATIPVRKTKDIITPALRQAVFERDGYRCKHCGDWHNLRCDHVIPEAQGGPTTIDNLQTLCNPCNCKKGARMEVQPS